MAPPPWGNPWGDPLTRWNFFLSPSLHHLPYTTPLKCFLPQPQHHTMICISTHPTPPHETNTLITHPLNVFLRLPHFMKNIFHSTHEIIYDVIIECHSKMKNMTFAEYQDCAKLFAGNCQGWCVGWIFTSFAYFQADLWHFCWHLHFQCVDDVIKRSSHDLTLKSADVSKNLWD